MAEALCWGVMGTGGIAAKFAEGLRHTDSGRLVAVGSRAAESARNFADRFGASGAHGSYEALLADAQVEAVYNSLPNSLHHPWTIAALEAGKHVLCEKPFASNVAEAEQMFDAADRAGRIVIEAFMYRTHPGVRKLIETVCGGAIGRIKIIRSNFTFNRTDDAADVRYQPALAGGSIMDVGCYCVNLTRALVGSEPSAAHAVAHIHPTGVDDYAAGVLSFDGDVVSSFTCGMTVDSDRGTYIGGSAGYITIDTPWFCDGRFTIVTEQGQKKKTVTVECDKGLYTLEAEAFAAAVRDGAEPWITRADTLGNMRVLDQLRQSAGLGY